MANTVLLSWPLVAMILFASLGREKGLIWTAVLGYLFLPSGIEFELPGLPDYNKGTAVSIGVLLGVLFFRHKFSFPEGPPKQEPGKDRFLVIIVVLLGILFLASVMTVLDNRAPLIDGDRVRSGLGLNDIISMNTLVILPMVPFLVACFWLRTHAHHAELLRVLVIMGVIYSLLALYEMRMSPHLSRTVYGFFPHDWIQHVRGGRFRPVVFLSHGLSLALFLLAATIAAFGLYRADPKRVHYLLAGFWILAVLFVSPNLGAAMLAFVFIPVLFLPRRLQARVGMVIAVIFLSFPAIRQSLPLDGFLNFVEGISAERAQSLEFRLRNEDDMLARAAEKPLWGWGGWGRWRVIDARGRDTTVSDGLWVINLGVLGWVGYLAFFGLLCLPLLMLPKAVRRNEVSSTTTAMALIVAANLVYLIPNSSLSPISWLLAGTIGGFIGWRPVARAEAGAASAEGDPEAGQGRGGPRYSRFDPGETPARPGARTVQPEKVRQPEKTREHLPVTRFGPGGVTPRG